jgi:hypothetical protein
MCFAEFVAAGKNNSAPRVVRRIVSRSFMGSRQTTPARVVSCLSRRSFTGSHSQRCHAPRLVGVAGRRAEPRPAPLAHRRRRRRERRVWPARARVDARRAARGGRAVRLSAAVGPRAVCVGCSCVLSPGSHALVFDLSSAVFCCCLSLSLSLGRPRSWWLAPRFWLSLAFARSTRRDAERGSGSQQKAVNNKNARAWP